MKPSLTSRIPYGWTLALLWTLHHYKKKSLSWTSLCFNILKYIFTIFFLFKSFPGNLELPSQWHTTPICKMLFKRIKRNANVGTGFSSRLPSSACFRHGPVLSAQGMTHRAARNPCVNPKDTNTLIGITEMKSAETQPSRSSPYRKENIISINYITRSNLC